MAVGKCHSLTILSVLSASLLLSFILIMSLLFLFFSLVLALSSGAPLSLLLTQRSSQCLLLLIQVSNPPPVKTGRGTGRAIRWVYQSGSICYRSSPRVPPAGHHLPPVLRTFLIVASPGPHTHTRINNHATPDHACACQFRSFLWMVFAVREHICCLLLSSFPALNTNVTKNN